MARVLFLIILLAACKQLSGKADLPTIAPSGKTLGERIKTPLGYSRSSVTTNSFVGYLRNIPLKANGTLVHYYNGAVKPNDNIYAAVLNIDPGNKDLMQCADAVMKLRAEYLYSTGQYDKIHFTFTNGFRADYLKWRLGYRISVHGNKAEWVTTTPGPASYDAAFRQYLDVVFSYCGTLSLSRELKHVEYADMQPGDVLIKGGTPGHAEIVMDIAKNAAGHKIFLLAQGYMPAQDIQVLLNPSDPILSPWYELNPAAATIVTPEYDFNTSQLMRFE